MRARERRRKTMGEWEHRKRQAIGKKHRGTEEFSASCFGSETEKQETRGSGHHFFWPKPPLAGHCGVIHVWSQPAPSSRCPKHLHRFMFFYISLRNGMVQETAKSSGQQRQKRAPARKTSPPRRTSGKSRHRNEKKKKNVDTNTKVSLPRAVSKSMRRNSNQIHFRRFRTLLSSPFFSLCF